MISKCSNSFTPGLDCISWRHLKVIINSDKYLLNIVNIANTYIDLGHWLSYFKMFTSIIIPKLNKTLYDSSKMFCPIVLLNTLEKLIEKVIGERLQHYSITSNFVHSNQLGGVIRWVCRQTLGLGLGQIRYSSSSIISLQWEREGTWLGSHMTWCHRARRV